MPLLYRRDSQKTIGIVSSVEEIARTVLTFRHLVNRKIIKTGSLGWGVPN